MRIYREKEKDLIGIGWQQLLREENRRIPCWFNYTSDSISPLFAGQVSFYGEGDFPLDKGKNIAIMMIR
jgi:hypothetical protein